MAPETDPPPSGLDGLQFQKAEFAGPTCQCCTAPITAEYYHLEGQPICPACAEAIQADQESPKHTWVLRGALFGLGVALGCGAAYGAFRLALDWDIALVSIGVGYAVGRAVRRGSYGLGGRRCQVLAVLLTYLAISISFVPVLYQAFRAQNAKDAVAEQVPPAMSAIMATVMSPAVPFFDLASGFSGLIGLAIVAFGLQQAWRQTARDPRLLMGPYQTEDTSLRV
ncbi:MAG: hypothetical protein K2X03_09230 [Bryobacteraceae bacterium]|nr:hypothetical protein [Bryobacteraceae bacterium]